MSAEAFAEAYCKGLSITERFLVSRGCHPDVAKEIAQAAWVKGWQYLAQLRHPNLLLHWVNSIALNMRRSVSRTPMMLPLQEFGSSWSLDSSIDLRRALAHLTERDRKWFEGFYLEGRAVRELAGKTSSSEGALRIRLHRIRKKMRERLTCSPR